MGVVYRARDIRLDREVAIKTLSDDFSWDEQRLQRFEREARALAALNHPNVATLYDVLPGTEDRAGRLVMELVEGETLADRIRRGPMPAREAALVFLQIAEGLEAAHEKGFVHRDLKPANIKVAADGRVKILDFGVAKALPEAGAGDLSGEGKLVGTPSFMSPEQLQGEGVDRRTDVWAFGVCLFETLAGRRPFAGGSVPQVLASVLKRDVDWQALPVDVPPPLRRLLRRCLEKEPHKRLRHIGDARLDLEEALGPEAAIESPPTATPTSARRLPMIGRIAVVGLCAAAVGAIWWSARRDVPARAPVLRLPLAWAQEPLANRVGFDRELEFAARPSDGRVIVYRHSGQLHVRRLDALVAEPLAGTENGKGPFFSPDGKWVGYFTDTEIKKVSVEGGRPQSVAEASAGLCGSWGIDGDIVFGRVGLTGLWRVPAAGGKPEPLTEPAAGMADHDWPSLLPGSRVVLFANAEASYALGEAQIIALSLVTGERRVLVEGGTYPRYSPSGHLLYAHDGALFAVRFDPERLELQGRPMRVVDGLQQGRNGSAQYSVASDGTLLYVRGGSRWPRTRPVWLDRRGNLTETGVAPNRFAQQTLSRDGTRIAAEVREPSGADLWVHELETGRGFRLTFDRAGISDPVWSLDDAEVYFTSGVEGSMGRIFRKRSNGTGTLEVLAHAAIRPLSLSPDGHLIGVGLRQRADRDVMMVELATGGEPRPIIATSAWELEPQVSPDGRWIAYVSDESGHNEIYVRPFPDVEEGRWQVSTRGGLFPRWHPSSRELFYLAGSSLMTVEIAGEEALRSGEPSPVTEGPDVGYQGGWGGFGVSPDGERFLLYQEVSDPGEAGELVLIVNWFAELEQLTRGQAG
jgi:serine/threonine-protein kinase